MTILIFIILLAVLIFVHELGHFIMAKISGIRVNEFGIGFPPRIFGFKPKKSETTYSINLIPFGGFVKIFGENYESGADSDGRSFMNKPKWMQSLTLAGGVLFNLIFAWILLSAGLMSGMPTIVSEDNLASVENKNVIISEIIPDSPAESSGLLAGDKIISIRTDKIFLEGDNVSLPSFQDAVFKSKGDVIVGYKRENQIFEVKMTPAIGILENAPAIGVGLGTVGIMKLKLFPALFEGLKTTFKIIWEVIRSISLLIYQALLGKADFSAIAGPVGIAGLVGKVAKFGFINLISFTAFISINLAVINMIPFPAFDGGRLLLILIEKIRGSVLKPATLNVVNIIGLVILVMLMAAVTYNDINRLFG